MFTLVVDDFGIKYVGKETANHRMNVLRKYYEAKEDWEGTLYYEVTLKWNYKQCYVDISMPNYVAKQLVKYNHKAPRRRQHCPYEPNPIKYGQNSDRIQPEQASKPLDKIDKKMIHQLVGSFYIMCVLLT